MSNFVMLKRQDRVVGLAIKRTAEEHVNFIDENDALSLLRFLPGFRSCTTGAGRRVQNGCHEVPHITFTVD